MSQPKWNLLVVDDSITDLQMTTGFLKEHFQVAVATSGQNALTSIAHRKPDVVLLDVNMPEMDGYEVCRKIREQHKLLKVIFVSANDSTSEILTGYDAGGDDYVVKPFSPEILMSKIHKAIRHSQEFVEVSKNAAGLAMEAMTSLGELGVVINFLKSSFRVPTVDDLAELMIGFLQRFNMDACFQLRTELNTQNYSTAGLLTPIEDELLTRIAAMNGRFAERGTRMFINYQNASLLIKNMPLDDEFKMGRLRDNLAIMLEGADEKLTLLALEEETQIALNYIQSIHRRIASENAEFIEKTISKIEVAFPNLGLTEKQEEHLIHLVSMSHAEFGINYDETRQIEEQIMTILGKMQQKLDNQSATKNVDAVELW